MTVAEMLMKLYQYTPDLDVKLTDGYKSHFYEGAFEFQLFEDFDGSKFVDIGIGGFEEEGK